MGRISCGMARRPTATDCGEAGTPVAGFHEYQNRWCWRPVPSASTVSKLKGGLVPQSVVPTILGVSRQRVHQLVEEGTFSYWTFYGMKWMSQDEVISFAKLNRQAGENQYKPSRKQMWKDAREAGSEFIRKRRASGS